VNSCPLSKISMMRVLSDRRSTSSLSRAMLTPTSGCVIAFCSEALSLTSCAPASGARKRSVRNKQSKYPPAKPGALETGTAQGGRWGR
jgi:hypothetical protein